MPPDSERAFAMPPEASETSRQAWRIFAMRSSRSFAGNSASPALMTSIAVSKTACGGRA
jgi:hypothetical protein